MQSVTVSIMLRHAPRAELPVDQRLHCWDLYGSTDALKLCTPESRVIEAEDDGSLLRRLAARQDRGAPSHTHLVRRAARYD